MARSGQRVRWNALKNPFPVLIVTRDLFASPGRIIDIGPPAIELRIDTLRDISREEKTRFVTRVRNAGIAVLVTARRKLDGGEWPPRSDEKRQAELLFHARLCDAVDIEADFGSGLGLFIKKIRGSGRKVPSVILSRHSCSGPLDEAELDQTAKLAIRHCVSRVKVAVMARRKEDVFRLADWATRNSCRALPVTAIAMGSAGAWTRWELPKLLGGPAYAPLNKSVAPGQVIYADLIKRLNQGDR